MRRETPPGSKDVRQAAGLRSRGRLVARISALWVGLLLVTSIGTLPLSLRWYNVQELDAAVRHAPSPQAVVAYERYDMGPRGLKPAARIAHRAVSWFGHDDLGRSLLYRVLPGALVSLAMGLAAAAMAVGIGTTWGAAAALIGGRLDFIMMRIVDVLYGLPYILMVILLKVGLTRPLTVLFGGHTRGADLVVLLLAIGGVSWLTMARVIRGQVLSLRSQPFVEASRAAGAGAFHIFRRHLLPNLVGPIAVYATLVVPQAMLQESFLSYLGIGIQQPTPSLGRLAADGVEAVNTFVGYWWLIVFPCAILVLTLLALNFIGDALRDAYDPKSNAVMLV
jgi:ABC-type dipeptide/oligopeptide/nickel transport system permease subunit